MEEIPKASIPEDLLRLAGDVIRAKIDLGEIEAGNEPVDWDIHRVQIRSYEVLSDGRHILTAVSTVPNRMFYVMVYIPDTDQNLVLPFSTDLLDDTPHIPDHDPVNHPSHYTAHPSGIECIQITREMNFNLGNAVKYIWRAGLKDTDKEIEDLEKAMWYLADEISRRKRNLNNAKKEEVVQQVASDISALKSNQQPADYDVAIIQR